MRTFSGLLAFVLAATSFVAAAPASNVGSVQDITDVFDKASNQLKSVNDALPATSVPQLTGLISQVVAIVEGATGNFQSAEQNVDLNSVDLTAAKAAAGEFSSSMLAFFQGVPVGDASRVAGPLGNLQTSLKQFDGVSGVTPLGDILNDLLPALEPLLVNAGLD